MYLLYVVLSLIRASSGSSQIDPAVMKNALMWTWQSYKTPIVITENGFGDLMHLGVHDTQRAAYHSVSGDEHELTEE